MGRGRFLLGCCRGRLAEWADLRRALLQAAVPAQQDTH